MGCERMGGTLWGTESFEAVPEDQVFHLLSLSAVIDQEISLPMMIPNMVLINCIMLLLSIS